MWPRKTIDCDDLYKQTIITMKKRTPEIQCDSPQKDSPQHDGQLSSLSSLEDDICPKHNVKSPEFWKNRSQRKQRHDEEDDEESSTCCTFEQGSSVVDCTPEGRHYIRRRTRWNDSLLLDECSDESSPQEAVQEAKLQVSFAEQTAREMEQVLDWWKQGDVHVSQSQSLRDNSLVYVSPQLSDVSDEEELNGDLVFMTPHHHEEARDSMLQSPFPSYFPPANATSLAYENARLESFLSPIVTSSYSPEWEAQEQSFAVDAVCSEAKRMEDVLAELEDTSVDGDDVTVTSIGNLQWCSLQDLPLLDRLWLEGKCSCQRCFLKLQQWLYHVLPPTLLSTWLSLKPHVRLFLWVLLPTLFLLFLYTTALLWNWVQPSRSSCVDSLLRKHDRYYWQSDVHYEIHSREWEPWNVDAAVSEFMETVLL